MALALAAVPPLHRTLAWAAAGRRDRVVETWVTTGGLEEAPPAALRLVPVSPRLSVSVPVEGPMSRAPLLSTDEVHPGLELRRPGDLGAGFRLP